MLSPNSKILENTIEYLNLNAKNFTIKEEPFIETVTGTYYLAVDNSSQKDYLIKIIKNPDNNSDIDSNTLNEIRLLEKIEKGQQNSNLNCILPYYGYIKYLGPLGEIQYNLFFDFRPVSLDNVPHINISFQDLKKIFNDLLNGYSYLQSIGISHQDLKLENILIDENFNASIFNFEAALEINEMEPETEIIILSGELYMSPEMKNAYINGDQKIKLNPFKSDVFSLGVLILKIFLPEKYEINFENLDNEILTMIKEFHGKVLQKTKIEERNQLDKFIEKIKKILEYDSKFRCDFIDIFKKNIELNNEKICFLINGWTDYNNNNQEKTNQKENKNLEKYEEQIILLSREIEKKNENFNKINQENIILKQKLNEINYNNKNHNELNNKIVVEPIKKNYELPQAELKSGFQIKITNERGIIKGQAQKQINEVINNIEDVNKLLENVKPLKNCNSCFLNKNPMSQKNLQNYINFLIPENFGYNIIKSISILAIPDPLLVKDDDWCKYWKNVFFSNEIEILIQDGFKFIIKHDQNWNNGIDLGQANYILDHVKNNWVNYSSIKNFTIFLHSWNNITDSNIKKLTELIKILKFDNLKTFKLGISSKQIKNSDSVTELLETFYKKKCLNKLEKFAFYIESNVEQNNSIPILGQILSGCQNLNSLDIFIQNVDKNANLNYLTQGLTPNLLSKLKKLSIGIVSNIKPYAETIDIDDVFQNFNQNLKNIKDLSIFLMSAGNIDLMVSPIFKSFDRSLDRCNIYFVCQEKDYKQRNEQTIISTEFKNQLEKKNPRVNIGAFNFIF